MPRSRTRAAIQPPTPPWVVRHRRTVLLATIGLSIAIRLACFLQLNGTPFIAMQQWRQTDMSYYDRWGRQIASGDWLSTSVFVPMHRWHRDVAAEYFKDHPQERVALEGETASGNTARDPDEVLWAKWMRLPQFYQDPLYAYLIAGTYRFVRADARLVLIGQLAAGVLTNVLIWLLARRFFGDVVAAYAAALAVLCGPFVFYEMQLLRDSLIVCAGLGLIWLADRALATGSLVQFGLLGLTLGAACLLKSTFVLLAVAMIPALFLSTAPATAPASRRRWLPAAVTAAGLAVAWVPLSARNLDLGAPALALASSGPLTFVASNDRQALPDVGFGIENRTLARFLGETDGGWRAALTGTLGTHTVTSYAALVWRKWDRLWHWFEIPNNENFYYARLWTPALNSLPVTFWLCAPLALVGLVLAATRWREVWLLYLLVVTTAAPMVLFYVLGRFRIALVAAVLPFAALALAEIAAAWRTGQYRRGFALVAAVLVVFAWTGRPIADDQLLIRMSDWIQPWSIEYESRVYGALDAKDPARAASAYLEFFDRYQPSDAQILASGDPRLAAELADMHAECARILGASGQADRAAAQLETARRLASLRLLR